jgi:hypothetical protein
MSEKKRSRPGRQLKVTSKCGVCWHAEAERIGELLGEGQTYKQIGDAYGFSFATISRHYRCCLKLEYAKMSAAKKAWNSFHFGAEILRRYKECTKMVDALQKWLADADNPEEFDIGPRDDEILVTYLEWREKGKYGRPTRKKATLRSLLRRIERGGTIKSLVVQSTAVDNRKLYLDSFRALGELLGHIAKFLSVPEKAKPTPAAEEAERLRALIEARANEKGIPFTEELRNYLDHYSAAALPEVKEVLISQLEQ